jgi:hypothetical protein
MKHDAERQQEYKARQLQNGLVRLNCWFSASTKRTIRELSDRHGKTQGEVLDLGVEAAANLLAGRLTVVRKPGRVIAQKPQQRPVAPSQLAVDTEAPPAQETAPLPPQQADEADDIIRRAAITTER